MLGRRAVLSSVCTGRVYYELSAAKAAPVAGPFGPFSCLPTPAPDPTAHLLLVLLLRPRQLFGDARSPPTGVLSSPRCARRSTVASLRSAPSRPPRPPRIRVARRCGCRPCC